MRAIDVEVYRHLFASIAEEMGAALMRSSSSPNIKERRDYSCAVFDAAGEMVAQAAHIPVHLGSTPMSVRAAMEAFEVLSEGDHVMLNDPYAGGTHLPDLTLVTPVFDTEGELCFYVANRAHHADIGGISPGSLPLSKHIDDEGFRIGPTLWSSELKARIMGASRTPEEREGDLMAQFAANHRGALRLGEHLEKRGEGLKEAARMLCDYAEQAVREFLLSLPDGQWEAVDWLDDDGHGTEGIEIRCVLTKRGSSLTFDLRGSADQVQGPLNVPKAVTVSAALYALRCITPDEIPTNSGLMRVIEVVTQPGSVVDAKYPAPVAAGNVETSQRLTDVFLAVMGKFVPSCQVAASGGSMNNVLIGGDDPYRGVAFAYYETIATGSGASWVQGGASAIQTHMTNTLNTPVEALEREYPLTLTRYEVRRGSGGKGEHHGGDGVIREYRAECDVEVTLMTERRLRAPWGVEGGADGERGRNVRIMVGGAQEHLPGKCTFLLARGQRLCVETPGGGGWGTER